MRKFIGVLLSVLCICCAAIGLTGCKKDKHIHAFDKQVITDEYKATDATCTEAAKYYYSCACGERGTETFAYGATKGHTEVIDRAKAATCTESGLTEGKHCSVCSTVLVKQNVVPAKGHTYSEEWTTNETEHWHSATCGHNVEKDRAAHTFDENKKCTVCDCVTVKPVGLELQSSVFNIDKSNKTGYLKVANAVTDYDFSDKFTVADGARFDVCTDKECNNKIASKKTDIVAGDNIFYILVTNGNDVASYTITLRRRPIYTVTFNANGGSAVNRQLIEEESFIPVPVTTRAGYTFISWSYDFTQPIMGDTIIVAAWMANINTTYKVEYYLENLEDNNYTLIETENSQGTTDTTATAEIKTYDHFTFYKNNSILSGSVSGDGSLVLKVYYTRNTYTLSNANTSYGEITNATTKKYGNDKIDSVATEYLGCEFLGWYNGEELLSIAREYTFTIKNNVTAKFKVKDELSNFNFNSSVDTCNITGVKDKTIKSAVIPDYVTSIGERAFNDCSSLTSLTIGNGVTSIGKSAFSGCSGLTSVTIPNSVTSIGKSAFLGCSGLTSVTIPNSVTSIGKSAFWGCSGLTSVTIPNSVTSIGDDAFYICSGLTSVTIPDSVTSIGDGAFDFCDNLKYNEYSNALYLGNKNNPYVALIKAKSTDITSCIINEKCKVISDEAFSYCRSLTSVTIGSGVTSIGDSAFSGCSGLTSVTIPDSVTSIGNFAFSGCGRLTSVTIPASVTSIGDGAFGGCSGIESLVVTTGNKKYHSANNCIIETETKKLIIGCKTSIIPSDGSVTSIGSSAFNGCSGLASVTIPDSVTSIGYYAFSDCDSLKYNEYSNALYLGNKNNPYVALIKAKSTEITSCIINEKCKVIGDYAFRYCSGLTSVPIPDSVTSIGNYAFYGCSGLTSLTIGNSVTSIDDSAFSGCSGLTSVTIPDSVTSIGDDAFWYCSGLTSVTIGNGVTSIGNSAFDCCYKLVEVINKSGLNITKGGGDNGNIAYYALSVKKDGTSDIVNKDGYLFYTYDNVNYLVAYVGSNTDLTLPDDYNGQNYKIYKYAFSYCSGLTSVTIGNGVTSIGDSALSGCCSLTSVTIGNSVTSIGDSAFRNCSSLTSVTIGNSVTSIGSYAFRDCSGLTSVTIPDSVTSIGSYAFRGCSGLTSITIPDSVTSIGAGAFWGCGGLTSVTIGNSVTSIGSYAFSYCRGLTSVTIPGSVTSIGESAFSYCSGLKTVFYKGTVKEWEKITKGYLWKENVPTTCVIHCTDGDIKISD